MFKIDFTYNWKVFIALIMVLFPQVFLRFDFFIFAIFFLLTATACHFYFFYELLSKNTYFLFSDEEYQLTKIAALKEQLKQKDTLVHLLKNNGKQ